MAGVDLGLERLRELDFGILGLTLFGQQQKGHGLLLLIHRVLLHIQSENHLLHGLGGRTVHVDELPLLLGHLELIQKN